jgi:hypothetical protein
MGGFAAGEALDEGRTGGGRLFGAWADASGGLLDATEGTVEVAAALWDGVAGAEATGTGWGDDEATEDSSGPALTGGGWGARNWYPTATPPATATSATAIDVLAMRERGALGGDSSSVLSIALSAPLPDVDPKRLRGKSCGRSGSVTASGDATERLCSPESETNISTSSEVPSGKSATTASSISPADWYRRVASIVSAFWTSDPISAGTQGARWCTWRGVSEQIAKMRLPKVSKCP